MRICITGPIATADIAHLLDRGSVPSVPGYTGAPLTAVLIDQFLKLGHEVVGVTTDSSLPLQRGQTIVACGPGFEFRVCSARPRAWRPNGWMLGRALDAWRWERRELEHAIREARADVVHAHWTYEFSLAALASGTPCVVTAHDSPKAVLRYHPGLYRWIRFLMARSVLRKAPAVTAVSAYMASELREFVAEPVVAIPNPVSSRVFDLGVIRTLGNSRRIAMVCNGWSGRKNSKPALEAFASFRRQAPESELHCFGNGFEIDGEGASWARMAGFHAGVQFHGAVPHFELIDQLCTMDALVHPALEESFGVVIAEAMALGLPIVAGRESGAVPWVLDADVRSDVDSAGILVDVRDSSRIASALHCIFDDRYGARSKAGIEESTRRFRPERVALAYIDFYRTLLTSAETNPFEHRGPHEAVIS